MGGNKESQNGSEENNRQTKQKFDSSIFKSSMDDYVNSEGFLNYDINNPNYDEKFREYLDNLAKQNPDLFFSLPNNNPSSSELQELKNNLQELLETNFVLRNFLIQDILKSFSKTFKIENDGKKKNSDIFKKLISELNVENLKRLLYYKSNQEAFLKDNKISYTLISEEIKLDKLNFTGLDTLNHDEKTALIEFINKTSSNSDIFDEELKVVLKCLTKEDQIKLLKFFIPNISLDKLVSLGIYSNEKRNLYKRSLINDLKYSSQISNHLKDEKLEEYINSLDLSNFILSLEDFKESDLTALVTKTKIQEDILININKLKSDVSKEEYPSKVDFLESLIPLSVGETRQSPSFRQKIIDTDKINDLFIAKIKDDSKLHNLHSSIDKLQDNNYIVIKHKDIVSGKEKRSVHRISKVDGGTTLYSKYIELEDLSTPYGILANGEKRKVSYEDFYELLKTQSSENNNENKYEIEFLSSEIKDDGKGQTEASEFELYKEKNKINEIESNDEIKDLLDFKFRIDEVDPKGINFDISKEKGCSFFIGKPGDKHYGYFSIIKIIGDQLILSSKDNTGKNEQMSLSQFYNTFVEKEARREAYIGDDINFFKNLNDREFFKKNNKQFELKDNKFIEKLDNSEEAREVEYMVGKDGKAIKIESIGKDNIRVSIGEYKEEKGKKEGELKRSFELSYPQTVSYEDLYAYINSHELLPFLEDREKKVDDIKDVKRGFSLGKAWFSMYSISDIISGLQMIPKTIEESLKSGNSIKAAQFAMSFGGLLPDQMRLQLQSNVESQEKKEMEALISKWSVTDSKDFIPIIRKIILNASSEEYEKEAALVFFLQKYGVLYGKGIKDLKGSFIWYKAMGGNPNDALYMKYKDTCEKGGIPFTEEGLLEKLFEEQVKGNLKPKRRSKFAKDYGGYIAKGIKEEKEDGELKAGKQLTIKGRLNYAVGELANGTYYNALGAVKKVWEKGGSAEQMYTIPFLITSSGISQNFTQDALNDYFNLSFTRNYSAIIFSKTPEDIALYNRVLLKLAKSLGVDADLSKALGESDESEKIKSLAKFWDKHGKSMVKKLNINEDPEIFLNKDKDRDFATYYERVKGVYEDKGFNLNKGDIQDGVYNYNHSSPFMFMGQELLNTYVSVDTQYGGIKGTEGKIVFWQTIEGYKDIANLKISEEEKKKMFRFYYDALTQRIETTYGDSINTPEKFRIKENANKGLLSTMRKMGLLLFTHYHAKGKSYNDFLEERWLDYKSRYIDNKSNFTASVNDIISEQDVVFEDVNKILSGDYDKGKKSNNPNGNKEGRKETFSKEEKIDIGLDDEELEEKQEECDTYMEILKTTKDGSLEQKQVVEKILNDELWGKPKKLNGGGYSILHPFYGEILLKSLYKGGINKKELFLILPKRYGNIEINNGKITYTNGHKK